MVTVLFVSLLALAFTGGFVSGEMWKDFVKTIEENKNARKNN